VNNLGVAVRTKIRSAFISLLCCVPTGPESRVQGSTRHGECARVKVRSLKARGPFALEHWVVLWGVRRGGQRRDIYCVAVSPEGAELEGQQRLLCCRVPTSILRSKKCLVSIKYQDIDYVYVPETLTPLHSHSRRKIPLLCRIIFYISTSLVLAYYNYH